MDESEVRERVFSIAADVESGSVTPYDGAKAIWRLLADELDEYPDDLVLFVGLASEWEDDPSHRPQYEARIRAAALELLRPG